MVQKYNFDVNVSKRGCWASSLNSQDTRNVAIFGMYALKFWSCAMQLVNANSTKGIGTSSAFTDRTLLGSGNPYELNEYYNGTGHIAPYGYALNRRYHARSFMVHFELCNVNAWPINLHVETIGWKPGYTPTGDLKDDITANIFSTTKYLLTKSAANTAEITAGNTTAIDAQKLKSTDITADEFEPAPNGNYGMQLFNADWNGYLMKNRYKRLVRRKKVTVPAGGRYMFKVKMRQPYFVSETDLDSENFRFICERALMIYWSSHCGVQPLGTLGTSEMGSYVHTEKPILAMRYNANVKGTMYVVQPKTVFRFLDSDVMANAATTKAQDMQITRSAQDVNARP